MKHTLTERELDNQRIMRDHLAYTIKINKEHLDTIERHFQADNLTEEYERAIAAILYKAIMDIEALDLKDRQLKEENYVVRTAKAEEVNAVGVKVQPSDFWDIDTEELNRLSLKELLDHVYRDDYQPIDRIPRPELKEK